MAWPINDQVKNPAHFPLTKDKARYVGDPVAVVVADSRASAKDAAELVEVDWDPHPAVTSIKAALKDGAPIIHEEFGTNNAGDWVFERDSPAPRRGPSGPFFEDPDARHDQGGVLPGPAHSRTRWSRAASWST